jgi:hypothetical protein
MKRITGLAYSLVIADRQNDVVNLAETILQIAATCFQYELTELVNGK